MTILLILNHAPCDGTDQTWNVLRLTGQLKDDGTEVRPFLMNDSVLLTFRIFARRADLATRLPAVDETRSGEFASLLLHCFTALLLNCGLPRCVALFAARLRNIRRRWIT